MRVRHYSMLHDDGGYSSMARRNSFDSMRSTSVSGRLGEITMKLFLEFRRRRILLQLAKDVRTRKPLPPVRTLSTRRIFDFRRSRMILARTRHPLQGPAIPARSCRRHASGNSYPSQGTNSPSVCLTGAGLKLSPAGRYQGLEHSISCRGETQNIRGEVAYNSSILRRRLSTRPRPGSCRRQSC